MMAYLCSSAQVSNFSECLNLMAVTEQKLCPKLNAVFVIEGYMRKNEKLAKWVSLCTELSLLCLADMDSFQLSLSAEKRQSLCLDLLPLS